MVRCLFRIDRKIIDFYPAVKVRHVDYDELETFKDIERIFRNINTPTDYKKFCK